MRPVPPVFHTSCTVSRRNRGGYTLLEILIVVSLIAIIIGMCWPAVRRFMGRVGISEAAEATRQELARVRLRSIDRGVTYEFRFEAGGQRYLVLAQQADLPRNDPSTAQSNGNQKPKAVFDGWTGTLKGDVHFGTAPSGNIISPLKQQPAAPKGPGASATSNSPQSAPAAIPMGGERIPQDRLSNIENGPALVMVLWDPAIQFFPEGRSDKAQITLSDKVGRSATIDIRSVTGTASWKLDK